MRVCWVALGWRADAAGDGGTGAGNESSTEEPGLSPFRRAAGRSNVDLAHERVHRQGIPGRQRCG